MPAAPVGVGLIGCGWIAEIAHLPTLRASNAGRLVAAADPDPSRRAWLNGLVPGVRLEAEWDAVLASSDVEAVLIAAPTALHGEAACRAFAAGKHVFLEKPVAVSVPEGRQVMDAWRRAGTIGMVGYNFRRNPVFLAAARRVAAGELGKLISIQGSFQWAAERIEGWRARPEAGGGVLLDLISHHADLVAALSGEALVEARCTVRTLRTPEDTAALEVATASGVTAHLTASFAAGAQVNRLDLVGTGGALRVDLLEGRPRRVERPPGRGARLKRLVNALTDLHPARLLRSPGREPSFGATLEAFLASVRSGVAAGPDLLDGLRALAVVEAAAASARAGGRPVPVEAVE